MMKKTSMMILGLLIVIVGAWSYQAGEAQLSSSGAQKIAVVNVADVLTKCQENLDREKEGEARQAKIKEDLQKLAAEAETIKDELQNALQPGTDAFRERRKEWFQKQAELQALQEYEKEALTIESQAWTETLYQKLLDEIKSISLKEGYSLVVNKDETPMKGRKLQDLYNLILNRKVLYSSPTLDITAQVLQSLDTTYEKAKADKSK